MNEPEYFPFETAPEDPVDQELVIEKNVQPPPRADNGPKIPFDDMEVGDSIKVEADTPRAIRNLRCRASRYASKNPPKRMSVRIVDPFHVRIWRLKDTG